MTFTDFLPYIQMESFSIRAQILSMALIVRKRREYFIDKPPTAIFEISLNGRQNYGYEKTIGKF